MSVKLTGDAMFTRQVNGLFNGADAWSLSTFFRYDGDPAQAPIGGGLTTSTQWIIYYVEVSRLNQAANPGQVGIGFAARNKGNNLIAGVPNAIPIAAGTVYHLAATWEKGLQQFWVNGIPIVLGRIQDGLKQGDDVMFLGNATSRVAGKPPSPATTVHSQRDLAIWINYALTPQDVAALRDGRAQPDTIGGSALERIWWKLDGPEGQTPVIAPGKLTDAFGNDKYRYASFIGQGSAVYADPMPWVPSASVVATVAESGTSLFTYMVAKSNGSWTKEVSFDAPPKITITGAKGGKDILLAMTPWHGGSFKGQLFMIPAPYAVTAASDTITLSAPTGWVNTAAGIAGPEVNTPVANCYGKSIHGDVKPTVVYGMNFPWFPTSNGSVYHLLKNFRYRSYWTWNGLTNYDMTKRPTGLNRADSWSKPTTPENPGFVTVQDQSTQANGVDLTGIPIPGGLWAVGWDDTGDPAHPTILGLRSEQGTANTFLERTDLANPGTLDPATGHTNGKVRVFDVGKDLTIPVRLTFYQDQYKPSFANDVVYMPGDFSWTAGKPTTLDRSDPLAFSDVVRERLAGGCGSMRFVDSELDQYSSTNMCEPEHLQSPDDWSYQLTRKSWVIPALSLRDWDVARTPFVYSPNFEGLGEQYTATLGAAITTTPPALTVEVINVPDASAAPTAPSGPVLTGLVLEDRGEKLRILGVAADGVSVTVERGACGTKPVAHAAGPVKVSYRHRMAGIADWGKADQGPAGAGNNVTTVVEVVTKARHDVQTMQFVPLANFPAVTLTDGYVWNLNNDEQGTYVTGPDSFVRAYSGFDQKQNGLPTPATNVTLPKGTTITLAANANCNFRTPDSPIIRYEATAKLASEFKADLQVNIPHAATDAFCWEVFRRIKKYLTPGRILRIELSNELWNPGYVQQQYWAAMDWMFYRGKYSWPALYGYASRRSAQITAIARAVFAERAGEVRCILNTPTWGASILPTIFKQWQAEGTAQDDIATAPYFDHDCDSTPKVLAYHVMSPEQVCDVMSWRFGYDLGGEVMGQVPVRKAIDDYNANVGGVNPTGKTLHLYGYEGGPGGIYPSLRFVLNAPATATDTTLAIAHPQLSVGMFILLDAGTREYEFIAASEWVKVTAIDPAGKYVVATRGQSGTAARAHPVGARCRNWDIEFGRDLERNPQFASVMRDYMIQLQKVGFERLNLYNYAMEWPGQYRYWGMYHTLSDAPGHGDGRPGAKENRDVLCRPGQPYTKPLDTNHITATDNVRGQQFIDWNHRATGTNPPPNPVDPPPLVDVQKNRDAFAAYVAAHVAQVDDGSLLARLMH